MKNKPLDYAGLYGQMHESSKIFPGYTLERYVDHIGRLIDQHDATLLLDYGCGKGYQYLGKRLHERWRGAPLPHCYDIGVRQLALKPSGEFEGVICTDVLEHIDEPDIPAILAELISYTMPDGFLFLGIACRPSKKRLPDGRDAHLTVRPSDWWIDRVGREMGKKEGARHVSISFEGMPDKWEMWG